MILRARRAENESGRRPKSDNETHAARTNTTEATWAHAVATAGVRRRRQAEDAQRRVRGC